MPQTRRKSSKELAISLTEKKSFYPGETIIGTITRWTPIVDPEAVLKIVFRGRAKCKLVRGQGNNRQTYKHRLDFWLRQPIKQELYRGPVHIPQQTEEPLSWYFAVTVPTQLSDALFRQVTEDARFMDEDDPAAYVPPATFASGLGTGDEFFIEYSLLATLRDSHGHEDKAVLPVTIRRSSTPTPINDFCLKLYRQPSVRAISTYRLDPAMATAELSFKQRAKEIFGSSKVPTLVFRLEVRHPTVLQIGHPEPAPFHVRGTMLKDRTSDAIQDTNPALVVTKVKVKLEELTSGAAKNFLSVTEDSGQQQWTLLNWSRKAPVPRSRTPSRQPSPAPASRHESVGEVGQGASSTDSTKKAAANDLTDSLAPPEYRKYEESDSEQPPPNAETLIVPWESAMLPLDLGQALQLRIRRPKYEAKELQASFESVSILTKHMLRWEIELDVAGEDCDFSGSAKITLLGPSDDDDNYNG